MTPQEREAFHDTRADDWAREVYKRNPPGESMTESTTPTLDAMEALKPYPNLYAIMQGTVSGSVTEWPAIRTELARLVGFFSDGMPKWIPVTERLPDGNGQVLAVNSVGYKACVTSLFRTPTGYDGEDATPEETDYPIGDVTHWMPLPEAPK